MPADAGPSGPEPIYRQATSADAGAIAAVGAAVLDELGDRSGLPGTMTADAVSQRLAGYGDAGAMFVCQTGEGVCGFAALEPDPSASAEGGPASGGGSGQAPQEEGAQTGGRLPCAVMGVWLLPSARRRGTGRELALMALEFARAAGYAKVRGTLPAGNEAALSFFSEIGALAQVVGGGMQYELPL
jgi:ribosomal protein S18 acetylase RimI-like enzyme